MTSVLDAFDPATWNDAERYYYERVDEALRNATDIVISNGRPQHAVYLIEKFLSEAKQAVRLFTGRLSRTYGGISVYTHPRVIAAAEELLRRPNSKLTVVLEEEIDVEPGQLPNDHPLVRVANRCREEQQMRGLLEVRRASETAIDILRHNSYRYHWMVMDDRAYRLETDTVHVKAHVNFGDATTTTALVAIFDRLLYPTSTELVRIHG